MAAVVVQATSTVWVDPSGSQVPAPSGGGGNTVALGAGIGAGVGVAVIVVGIFVWLCMRRRRRNRAAVATLGPASEATPPMAADPSSAPYFNAAQSMSRKPVAAAEVIPSPSPVSELNGYGQRLELGSKSVSPPPPVSPVSFPVPAPVQTRPHEVWNNSPRPELYGQGGSPPPHYHQLDNTNRTELP